MALQRCQTVWGNTTVVRSAPLVEHHRDVIFVPFSEGVFLDHDRAWGIFDSHGRLIDAAGYYRGPNHGAVCQDPITSFRVEDLPEAPEQSYIYGGPIINHYGHFIITTLSRFWQFPMLERQIKILCHSHGSTSGWLDLPYRSAIMNNIGITTADFATFHEPTRIRHLIMPRVAFEEQNYTHTIMAKLCHRIGNAVLAGRPRRRNEIPVYFSKTGLSGGVTRFSNEDDVIEVLLRHGIEVLQPENMPFADQVYEFATRTTIVGSSSSAFHTSIFVPAHAHLVCIAPSDLLNSNFCLIDKINGNWAEYFYPEGGTVQNIDAGGFMLSSHVPNPVQLAEDILRSI